jgi:hypothetical protein
MGCSVVVSGSNNSEINFARSERVAAKVDTHHINPGVNLSKRHQRLCC